MADTIKRGISSPLRDATPSRAYARAMRAIGREPLFSYLVALAYRFTDPGAYGIHLVSAIVGSLTVPAVWLAARELFREQRATVLAYLPLLARFLRFALAVASAFFSYDQLQRSWYMFFFPLPWARASTVAMHMRPTMIPPRTLARFRFFIQIS